MEAKPEDIRRGQAVVRVLSCVLEKVINASSGEQPGAEVVTKFHSQKLPGITIREYLERIQKYAYCSNECFVLALIYIDRLIQYNGFTITALNVHRVVITSVLLAAKFFDDQYFNNAHYAKVGGLPLAEMNALEVEFCFRINFRLHVTDDVYEKYHSELANHSKFCRPCKPCIPSFPKLNPYMTEEAAEAALNVGTSKWMHDEPMEVEDAADVRKNSMSIEQQPPMVMNFKGTATAPTESAASEGKAGFGGAVTVAYAPILNQCGINTWGVPAAPLAVSGPMYYPLYYS
mmetsp:Transcript_38808/g.121673  ORF Transcript_38808/g.121673 Transcript_38808/m.121673 type:complete len:289 (-) Transcript_38808:404-1270(-)